MADPVWSDLGCGFLSGTGAGDVLRWGMGTHHHAERPWRVSVIGDTRGAGVLLGDRSVLTCAHVVGGENERVPVASSVTHSRRTRQSQAAARKPDGKGASHPYWSHPYQQHRRPSGPPD